MQEKINKSQRNDSVKIETDIENLRKLKFKTGRSYTIVLKTHLFLIQVEIDPNDPATKDDSYTLFSSDNSKTYTSTLTPKDDLNQNDSYITLSYYGLKRNLHYTLEIDPGVNGETYLLFENISYNDLIKE